MGEEVHATLELNQTKKSFNVSRRSVSRLPHWALIQSTSTLFLLSYGVGVRRTAAKAA